MNGRLLVSGACLLLLCGCAGLLPSREPDTLQPVETMGFDAAGEGLVVSVSDTGDETVRLCAGGRSIPDAAERLQILSDREMLFFAHVRYALLGEAAARDSLPPVLDWFRRSPQTRLTVPLLVVRDGEARALVAGGGDGREATGLLRSLEEDTERTGGARFVTMLELTRRMARSGAALCAAVRLVPGSGSLPDRDGALAVLPAGYAVLRNGTLAGYLDPGPARGADLLMGRAGAADYVLSNGATVRLRRATADVSFDGRSSVVRVKVDARAGILAWSGREDVAPGTLAAMEAELSSLLASECAAALAAARDMEADYLELWPRYKGDLPRGELLRRLGWEIAADSRVVRSWDVDGGVSLGGGAGA